MSSSRRLSSRTTVWSLIGVLTVIAVVLAVRLVTMDAAPGPSAAAGAEPRPTGEVSSSAPALAEPVPTASFPEPTTVASGAAQVAEQDLDSWLSSLDSDPYVQLVDGVVTLWCEHYATQDPAVVAVFDQRYAELRSRPDLVIPGDIDPPREFLPAVDYYCA